MNNTLASQHRPLLAKLCSLVIGALLLLATAVACGAEPPAPAPATSTPDIQGTITALAQSSGAAMPTPTPVPAQIRGMAVEFAIGYRSLVQDWERLHSDFDGWRYNLVACDASSVQAALGRFSARSGEITQSTRRLPRHSVVRDLADQLIVAAEKEEEALRLLRDTWRSGEPGLFGQVIRRPAAQPVAPASQDNETEEAERPTPSGQQTNQPSPFQRAEMVRSETWLLRQEVEDRLRDLQGSASPHGRTSLERLARAFRELNSSWEQLHQDYDSFRQRETSLTVSQSLAEVNRLISELNGIIAAIRQLPVPDATRSILPALSDAAEAEDLALRQLRTALQGLVPPSPPGPEEVPPSPGEDPNVNSDPAQSQGNPNPYDALDAQVAQSKAARRQIEQQLEGMLELASANGHPDLEEFMTQYDTLRQELDEFHQNYDSWRRTEGGCERDTAIGNLGQFTIRAGELAARARGLPSSPVLQPMAELLVEAAEREEEALRTLRNTWRPFDASVYQSLDQERNQTRRLRRHVDSGIHDLLDRYGVAPDELAR